MTVRPDSVEALIEGALKGMDAVGGDYTGAELLCATFATTLRIMKSSLLQSPESLPAIRQAVEVLLMECAPRGQSN